MDKADIYILYNGDDSNPGTEERPFATLKRAKEEVRKLKKKKTVPMIVFVREGTYYLDEPLTFIPEDSGTEKQPVIYSAYPGEMPTISGGKKLECNWESYRDGIMMCKLPEVKKGNLHFSQLFINGKRQIRARYPNYDCSDLGKSGYIYAKAEFPEDVTYDNGAETDEDMTFAGSPPRGIYYDPETFTDKKWSKPNEAVIHIFQALYWGNLQFEIKDIDWDCNIIWFGEGGTQMGAQWYSDPCKVNKNSRFYIENVFKELDAPGEWYLDKDEGILYYMPVEGLDLSTAKVEVPVLEQVIEFRGIQKDPVEYITFSGFRFAHTSSTFFEEYEIPSLGDWAIHRGGTFFLEGTRHCVIEKSFFVAVGGNAIFLNNYNRNARIESNKFAETGDSAICLVGSHHKTVGSQRMFPCECTVNNNLIHDCGVFGKQIAGGVYIKS